LPELSRDSLKRGQPKGANRSRLKLPTYCAVLKTSLSLQIAVSRSGGKSIKLPISSILCPAVDLPGTWAAHGIAPAVSV
jgi:hypothetical protein